MPPLIRIFSVALLTIILIILLSSRELFQGLTLLVLSILATYNLAISYRRSTVIAYLLSSLITATILGIGHNATWSDVGIVVVTTLLTTIFIDAIIDSRFPTNELLTLIATILILPFISGIWWAVDATSPHPQILGDTVEERKFNRIVQASGVTNQTQVRQELEARFGTYNSSSWKNGVSSVISETGPWPLHVFFAELADDGNALAQGLWGKHVDDLRIVGTSQEAGELEALLNCRKAIINLLATTIPVVEQYTPFFQASDFGNSNNPLGALGDKIYQWSSNEAHRKAIVAHQGCDIRPGPSATLLSWVQTCIEPINGELAMDPDLKSLKNFGNACKMVKFVDN